MTMMAKMRCSYGLMLTARRMNNVSPNGLFLPAFQQLRSQSNGRSRSCYFMARLLTQSSRSGETFPPIRAQRRPSTNFNDDDNNDDIGTGKVNQNKQSGVEKATFLRPDPVDRAKNVFVGNLTPNTTEQQLRSHLTSTGLRVTHVEVIKNRDGASKCCAVISFETPMDAIKAVHTFHSTLLDGRNILVKSDEPRAERGYYTQQRTGIDPARTVFVTNIRYHVTEKQLWNLFSSAGRIATLKYYTCPNGRPLGRARIIFWEPLSAAVAVSEFNNLLFEGREIHIRYCNPE